MPNKIVTPRVRRAQRELLLALSESIQGSDLFRGQAEAGLSGLMSDLWNEVEHLARRRPERGAE